MNVQSMVRVAVLSALFVILPHGPSALAAQTCVSSVQPAQGDLGYRVRGERCEGLYVAEISTSALELVSLTDGPLEYSLEVDTLMVYAATETTPGPVHLRALGRRPRTYYRMDAAPDALPFPWSSDVLKLAGMTPDRTGMYGFTLAAGDTTFVPVRVGEFAPSDSLELVLRTAVDTEGVVYKCRPAGGPTNQCANDFGEWTTLPLEGGMVPAGAPMTLRVPKSLGAMHLDIAIQPRDSTAYRPPLTVQIAGR